MDISNIPMAIPIENIPRPKLIIPVNNTFTSRQPCKDCGKTFTRYEKDKYNSSYFRCEKCRNIFFIKSCKNSCLVS